MTSQRRVLLLLKPSPAREALSLLLDEQGFEVAAQPSTFRAVSRLAREPFDVVIVGLDDLLDEELEVIGVIREERPEAFLLVTFTPINRRKAQEALDLGADGYVLEPVNPSEIAAALRHLGSPVERKPVETTTAEEQLEAEPLKPEEIDFITSSLGGEAPAEEEENEEAAQQAPAHGNGRHAEEQPQFDETPPPSLTATTVETPLMPDRVASLRKLGASVAHEINNPLTTLSGWIQLLLKKANGNHDLRRTLVNMKEEADRIADVVRELSAISEPDLAGRVPVDINTIAEDIIECFVNINGNSQIQVKRILTSDAPCIKADRNLLVRAVCDLLNTSYLDLGNSGSLVFTTTIGPDWVEFNVYEPGSQVDLEPFGRALGSVNLGDGEDIGKDLALARCQEIIGSHGGTFTAECDPREGLSFQLRIPKIED